MCFAIRCILWPPKACDGFPLSIELDSLQKNENDVNQLNIGILFGGDNWTYKQTQHNPTETDLQYSVWYERSKPDYYMIFCAR